jgi:hypothetical protein
VTPQLAARMLRAMGHSVALVRQATEMPFLDSSAYPVNRELWRDFKRTNPQEALQVLALLLDTLRDTFNPRARPRG